MAGMSLSPRGGPLAGVDSTEVVADAPLTEHFCHSSYLVTGGLEIQLDEPEQANNRITLSITRGLI